MNENESSPLVVAIDGPAGAGKSTVAAIIAARFGLLNLESGAMYRAFALKAIQTDSDVDDREELGRLAAKTRIRLVPGAGATAVEQVGLGDRARARLRTLSGGMLRRAGVAQAIVNQPELLLLDEPTAGLDPEQRVAFRALLRDLGERSTVIVSTHLVEDVGAACGEVALMDAGKVVFRGTPDELTARGEGTGAAGDAPLERGYSAALAAARSATAVRS